MKKVTAVLLAVGLTGAYAQAGIVSFTPDKEELVIGGDTVVTFEVRVFPDALAGANLMLVHLGSDTLRLTDFVLDPGFTSAFIFNQVTIPSPISANPEYLSDLVAEGFTINDIAAPQDGFLLGVLTVDAAGLDVGSYTVMVDSERDTQSVITNLAGTQEGLFGMATVNVVPEPATLALLSVAAVGGLVHRRRRQAR